MNTNKTNSNMENKGNLVKEVDIVFMARRIRILGIAILLGIIIVYGFGLSVAGNYINEDLSDFNLVSFIICAAFCVPSFFVKKALLKNLNDKNFISKYYNAHLIPFVMCDMGGLFCIVTNLFVNQNLIYATAGFLVAVFFMVINFPKSDDYTKVKSL
ncbi:MAG: hypothetical protein NTU73_02940 [Ignavibacteriae bacterium]|nr:hypothetical protein [Ignavibacteriota bacterium]